MTRTVADQFAETLAAAGINRIYGIVGDSLNGFTDALRRQGNVLLQSFCAALLAGIIGAQRRRHAMAKARPERWNSKS
jgi:hypothetical protein